ncbi:MAG: hypothetical protein JWP40_1443 [Blastococcus sp.]|nr:hypothetical protein [Blastococcus sp.]
MSTTTDSTRPAAAPPRSPATGWSPAGRVAAATTLAVGGALWTVGDLIGFGKDGSDHVAYMHDHPGAAGIGITADVLGTLFIAGTALAWFLLSRRRSPRLAVAGAVLLAIGLAMQWVLEGVELTQFALVRQGAFPVDRVADSLSSPTAMGLPGYLFMPMFMIGAFLGIVVAMIALWRSGSVSRTAIVLVLLFQLAQLIGVVPGSPFLFVGLLWMAVDVLRSAPAPDPHAAPVVR